ncbi:MAG: peptidoglycan DD-metalloendopeptidase family protein [Verrucomicrobiota bacterium]
MRTLLGAFSFAALASTVHSQQIDWTGPIAEAFALPLGDGTGAGYEVVHEAFEDLPGERWDGNGGGDTDLGDPVSTIGDGVVIFSEDTKGKWGNMVIIRHAYMDENGKLALIDSIYAFLLDAFVRAGDEVYLGDKIGAIGKGKKESNPSQLYLAIRREVEFPIENIPPKLYRKYYHDPRTFISEFKAEEKPVE